MTQTYSNLEILVYDDSSTDGTNSIVTRISKEDKRVKIINGKSLPDGWRGKNFACWNLSKDAVGSYFLLVQHFMKYKIKKLTCFLYFQNKLFQALEKKQ